MTDVAAIALSLVLAICRTGTMMLLAPLFGPRGTHPLVKVAIGGGLGYLLLPAIRPPQALLDSPRALAEAVLVEVLVGLVLGTVLMTLFEAVSLAGRLFDTQMGFGLASVISPEDARQESVLGQYLRMVAVLVFFSLGGHLEVLRALADSYRLVPVAGVLPVESLPLAAVVLGQKVLVLAIRLAVPVAGAIFLADVALGLLARAVPTMNVFIVGFPFKIGLGLLVLAASLEVSMQVFAGEARGFYPQALRWVGGR